VRINKTKAIIVALSIACISMPFLSSCRGKERLYRKSAILMDTLVAITVSADSKENASAAIDAAFAEIKGLEARMSFWSPDSEISAINKYAGVKKVKVSPQTLELTEKALFVSEKTGGAFDPTIGPVIRLYDFKEGVIPGEDKIKERLGRVDWRKVVADRTGLTVYLSEKGMSFDTGGILKGYAADVAVQALKDKGIKGGLVAIAGDIKAFGLKPGGGPWNVGIRNPRPESEKDDVSATVALMDEAISTSGDYERFFIKDGVRYHHILDPKTGRPAAGVRSVTVIAKEGVMADGFSTGIFVMGPEKGMRLLKKLGFEGVIVDGEGKIHMTEGLKERLQFQKAGGHGGL